MIESFSPPGDIIHPTKRVKGEYDEVGRGVEYKRKGTFDRIANHLERAEADGVDQN